MYFFLILLLVVAAFLLLLKLFASLTGRVSERLLTSHFRALEALLEHESVPDEWSKQAEKIVGRDRSNRYPQSSQEAVAKSFLLKKIRALSSYFENSPFVESSEARELLLGQLAALEKRWEASELAEILAYHETQK